MEGLFPLGIDHYVIGGLLVGIGISLAWLLSGLVAGASTIFTSSWSYILPGWFFQQEKFRRTRSWRITLALGLMTGGFLYYYFVAEKTPTVTGIETWRLLLGGVIIGIGTRMSGGCASGHGICGNAALEKVSLVATVTFLITAIVVANLTSSLLGL